MNHESNPAVPVVLTAGLAVSLALICSSWLPVYGWLFCAGLAACWWGGSLIGETLGNWWEDR